MKPTLTPEQYAIERAICDKAEAYRARVAAGRNYLTAEEAVHPDYVACNNAMRGRVQQYEILSDPGAVVVAYLGKPENWTYPVTVWTGDVVGTARAVGAAWRPPNSHRATMQQFHATIAGRKYTGRGEGAGMVITFRETAESKRARDKFESRPIFINWQGPAGVETIDSVYPEGFTSRAAMRAEAKRLVSEYALAGMRGAYLSSREAANV